MRAWVGAQHLLDSRSLSLSGLDAGCLPPLGTLAGCLKSPGVGIVGTLFLVEPAREDRALTVQGSVHRSRLRMVTQSLWLTFVHWRERTPPSAPSASLHPVLQTRKYTTVGEMFRGFLQLCRNIQPCECPAKTSLQESLPLAHLSEGQLDPTPQWKGRQMRFGHDDNNVTVVSRTAPFCSSVDINDGKTVKGRCRAI